MAPGLEALHIMVNPNDGVAGSWSNGPPNGSVQYAKAARSSSAATGPAAAPPSNPCNTNALPASSAIFRLDFIEVPPIF